MRLRRLGVKRWLGVPAAYWLLAGLALILLLLVPRVATINLLTILILANIWAILAMSWDILSGYTGQISFGHSFFFGLGGYTSGLLALYGRLSPWLTLWLGGLVAAVGGLLIALPALRLHGPYLALITLLAALVADRMARFLKIETAGAEGALYGIPPLSFNWNTTYYYSSGLMLLVALVLVLVARSKMGKVFEAIRDDEEAAEAAGLNTAKYKILAFAISGFVAGLSGAFLAHYMMIVSPRQHFDLELSVEAIIAAVLGGMGTITGPIVGAYFLVLVREYLRPLGVWRMLIFTLLALLFLFFLPRGVTIELGTRFRKLIRIR